MEPASAARGPDPAARAAAPVTVRPARREDMPLVHQMILELAEYEGVPEGPRLSVADLTADGFDASPPWFFVLIAERRGEPLGHAMVNRAYSSWTRRAFYLEDLYVRASARRQGVGLALLQRLCEMAVAEGVARIDWHVMMDNASALRFYERLGARDLRASEGRAALRLDAPRIAAVARGQLA